MQNIVDFIISSLNTVWFALIADPIKTIGAFASIGALIISWKNFKKDTTRISISVKRAQNGAIALQHPTKEYLLFEVCNKGILAVVINDIGIRVCGRFRLRNQFISLVDMPMAHIYMKGDEKGIGSLECVELPGSIPARTLGVFLLDYSGLKKEFTNCPNRDSLHETKNFGYRRVINAFNEFQKLEHIQGKYIQVTPYILTGSGERFVGKKSIVELGNLGDIVR